MVYIFCDFLFLYYTALNSCFLQSFVKKDIFAPGHATDGGCFSFPIPTLQIHP